MKSVFCQWEGYGDQCGVSGKVNEVSVASVGKLAKSVWR